MTIKVDLDDVNDNEDIDHTDSVVDLDAATEEELEAAIDDNEN